MGLARVGFLVRDRGRGLLMGRAQQNRQADQSQDNWQHRQRHAYANLSQQPTDHCCLQQQGDTSMCCIDLGKPFNAIGRICDLLTHNVGHLKCPKSRFPCSPLKSCSKHPKRKRTKPRPKPGRVARVGGCRLNAFALRLVEIARSTHCWHLCGVRKRSERREINKYRYLGQSDYWINKGLSILVKTLNSKWFTTCLGPHDETLDVPTHFV